MNRKNSAAKNNRNMSKGYFFGLGCSAFLFLNPLYAKSLTASAPHFSIQFEQTPQNLNIQTHELTFNLDLKNCPKDFAEDVWMQVNAHKATLKSFEQSTTKKTDWIRFTESKKTLYIAQASDFGIYLSKLPNVLRTLHLRWNRQCLKK